MAEKIRIQKYVNGALFTTDDVVATEAPLEISLTHQGITRPVSVTMRTPGNDIELAIGFLLTEGLIHRRDDIIGANILAENAVEVQLSDHKDVPLGALQRHFYTSSSCGVCGKASLEALEKSATVRSWNHDFPLTLSRADIGRLPERLRASQSAFDETGGMHAAAFFAPANTLPVVREDVGRHNALDKLIGHFFLHDQLPLNNGVLLLSGRASFELLQKAAAAGIRAVCAIGAPSSLAVEVARRFDITLLGFVKTDRFNIYHQSSHVNWA